jgi:hypothetical protein
MAANGVAELPPEAENELVAELARLALEQAAPEELVLFPGQRQGVLQGPAGGAEPRGEQFRVGVANVRYSRELRCQGSGPLLPWLRT